MPPPRRGLPLPPIPGQTVGGGVPDAPRRLALPPTTALAFPPLGEGGPAGPDEGQAPAAARPRVTTRGDSRCRQHPRRGQDPSLRTEPLTGVRVIPRAGHARPLPRGGPGTGVRVNSAGVSISPSVGRGAPTPPQAPAAAHPRANRRAASPPPRGGLRCRQQQPLPSPLGEGGPAGPDEGQAPVTAHSPGYHPRRLPLPPTPAEGSRPLPTDRTIDGCPRNPPGRACPAPTARRPGNGCPRKPHSVSISPSVGRGAPTPPRPPAAAHSPGKPQGAASPTPRGGLRCRQQQPLPSPSGEGGPAGPDEGQAPAAAHSPGYHPRRLPLPPTPAEGSRPLPTDRTIDRCPRNPRAGHARPLPGNNPTHLYTT